MAQTTQLPDPPDLTEAVFAGLEQKAALPLGQMVGLGILAGLYIGFGGLFATVALAGAEALPYGMGQIVAGLVFSLGLALVVIAGAELFTGNTLFAGPVAAGRISLGSAARALCIVYIANLIGALLLAVLALLAGVHEGGDGAVGRAALKLAAVKVEKPFATVLASGILANMLVCLAVWMANGGHTITDKLFGLLLPITAFVAAGLEHSVANMYLLPYALLVQGIAGEALPPITLAASAGNLAAATIGNLIGGSFVALIHGYIHGKR